MQLVRGGGGGLYISFVVGIVLFLLCTFFGCVLHLTFRCWISIHCKNKQMKRYPIQFPRTYSFAFIIDLLVFTKVTIFLVI